MNDAAPTLSSYALLAVNLRKLKNKLKDIKLTDKPMINPVLFIKAKKKEQGT